MALIIEEGKVNNGGIVLSKPLLLPEGIKVRIQIEAIDTDSHVQGDDSQNTVPDESEAFTSLPCFGMWADREDMRDSIAWLHKERKKWQQRFAREA